jgi:hypothetical protein
MTPQPPTVRYDTDTITAQVSCGWCHKPFPKSGRRRFCSDACKQAHWRARQTNHPAQPPLAKPDTTVYECPSCDQRYLGTQRCDDCNTFCRRIGPGGPCPHCDEPVAHADLHP